MANLLVNRLRNADASGIGEPLEPSSNIHNMAKEVATLVQHLTEMNSDPEMSLASIRQRRIQLREFILCRDGASDRRDRAVELQ